MLGAAHAAANPLTARFNTTHGIAVGLMMPHVIRFNAPVAEHLYQLLPLPLSKQPHSPQHWGPCQSANALADCFTQFLQLASLPTSISAATATTLTDSVINELATDAALQWTGTFNPRKMDQQAFVQLYLQAR
jgi:alcohol dehydrogenase